MAMGFDQLRPRFISAAGLTWHVLEGGEGPPVLMLHGFPENSLSWRNNASALVDAGFRVLIPDLKGYGLTDKPRPGTALGDYRVSHMAAELSELLAALGHERADIIGHDWGGVLLSAMIYGHRQRVRRAVLVNAPFKRLLPHKPRHIYYFNLPGLPERAFWRTPVPFIEGIIRRWSATPDAFSQEDVLSYVRAFQRGGSISCALAYYRSLRRDLAFIARAQLASPPAGGYPPSLVLYGDRDPIFPLSVAIMAQKDLGGAQLTLLRGAGHFPHAEQPSRFNSAVLNFLSS